MQPLIPRATFLPTLVFDPELDSARRVQAVKDGYFRVIVVVADLANEDCLQFLESVHRAAPWSWLIVANGTVNRELRALVHQRGGDALVKAPIDPDGLADRIWSFQAAPRPLYWSTWKHRLSCGVLVMTTTTIWEPRQSREGIIHLRCAFPDHAAH